MKHKHTEILREQSTAAAMLSNKCLLALSEDSKGHDEHVVELTQQIEAEASMLAELARRVSERVAVDDCFKLRSR